MRHQWLRVMGGAAGGPPVPNVILRGGLNTVSGGPSFAATAGYNVPTLIAEPPGSRFAGGIGMSFGDNVGLIANDPSFTLDQDFTISSFIQPRNNRDGGVFIGDVSQTSGLIVPISGAFQSLYWNSSIIATLSIGNLNNWHHVAVTSSNETIRVFINGIAVITFAASFPSTVGRLILGRSKVSEGDAKPFVGYLDDFLFFPGSAIWTTNFVPPATYWPYL